VQQAAKEKAMTERLPDTDSTDVMQMAVSLWLTDLIWGQVSRTIHADDAEKTLTSLYARVFASVQETKKGK
jgi:hypothetical protein